MLKDVGLGVLCWKSYETLRATLESYSQSNFLSLFSEKVIYFQEIDDEAREIAKHYGFEAHGNESNTGIYGGFRGLSESMKSRYILLLENDWQLSTSIDVVKFHLDVGLDYLLSGRCRVIYYRNLSELFEQDYHRPFRRFYPIGDVSLFRRFIMFLYRLRSPIKYRRSLYHALCCLENPENHFSIFERDSVSNFLFVSSRYKEWSNNPFLIEKDFFESVVLSRVDQVDSPTDLLVNGFKSIENELNISDRSGFSQKTWWNRRDYIIGISSGLFLHNRIGDRGY